MSDTTILESLLMIRDGRKRAVGLGLEVEFDKEIERIRKKLPDVSFQELAKLQMEILSKQRSYTLEEKRAQIQSHKEQSRKLQKEQLREQYLKYGNKEETFEEYYQQCIPRDNPSQ